ncbi:MAG: hypothetical protein K9M94_00520 [Spirochaetia bacterium]|nr:hypothetical protein [Spirochaetia bacterium]
MNALQEGRSLELSQELLKGAIDLHVHVGPHLFSSPRRQDPIECAIEARAAGMRAFAIVDVFEMSNGYTWIVNRHVDNFTVYGGLALNTVYGGMNPRAVKTALYYGSGAKYISFGTHSTYYQAAREGRIIDGEFKSLADIYPKFKKEELSRAIRIPLEEEPGEALDEILRLIADHPDVYMDTGHVSPEEAMRLCDLKEKYGYEKIVISSSVVKVASMQQLEYMVKKGAYIEQTLGAYTAAQMIPLTHYYVEKEYSSVDEGMDKPVNKGVGIVADQVAAFGAENMIMDTDFGRYALSSPVEGLRQFISMMLDIGVSAADVRTMVKTNPEKILSLEAMDPDSFPLGSNENEEGAK